MRYLLLFVITILLISACDKENCPNRPLHIIEECSEQDLCMEEAKILSIDCCNFENNDEWIITNETDYKAIQKPLYPIDSAKCKNYKYPEIDFTTHTLLIKGTFVGGCNEPFYSYRFELDTIKNECNISINIWQEGSCSQLFGKYHKLLIPVLPPEYSINFNVNEYCCDCLN